MSTNVRLVTTNSKLKIAVLGTRGFPGVQGGVETHCENLYPVLVQQGCEVVVFARRPYVQYIKYVYKGVKLISLPCPKHKFLESILHTLYGVFAAKRISPDILHIHAIGPSLIIPVARLLGLKVVMTNHGPDYQRMKWGKLAKLFLKLGEYAGSTWAHSIICISESIANFIREKYKRDVAVIPNGVILPEVLQTSNALIKYGLEKKKYILTVGRFVPEKGFHDLIDAFDQLLVSNTTILAEKWRLVIVGQADHEDKYSINLKAKASGNSNIILTGFLKGEPLLELYSHAGLFVLPSYYEGLPIVLLEAMSYGLSCIVSDIPANKNIELSIQRFFRPGDIKSIALKMEEFIKCPLSEEEGQKQRKMIAKKFSWETIALETREVYRSTLNEKCYEKE